VVDLSRLEWTQGKNAKCRERTGSAEIGSRPKRTESSSRIESKEHRALSP
jgi:hypothetical protein